MAKPKKKSETHFESLYKKDLYAWSKQQKDFLQSRDFKSLDIENIIEEIDSVGRSERHELINHLRNLLMHLLKCQFQPSKHTRSWDESIRNARLEIFLF